jgi:hypothetical protein
MKRLIALSALLVAAFAFAGAAGADPGPGKGTGKPANGRFGPFQMSRTDGSSCGIEKPWATDTFVREYTVKRNEDGTFRITRSDRGTFMTNGKRSPGRCETTSKHGTVVPAGVVGKFHGYLTGVVSGGTFNPNATCPAAEDCGLTDVFLKTFFGPHAQFSCFAAPPTQCRFNFEYSAPKQGLKFHLWQDRGVNDVEVFQGDIATK